MPEKRIAASAPLGQEKEAGMEAKKITKDSIEKEKRTAVGNQGEKKKTCPELC
ncbi:MAG: hypothetical protein WGN25_10840 [Candidatus Electrothrix sp. GW3-4]|uniref:hypothetical protein n=1 Tax=Candidatus Electrothrix sp. GW3-4 TaxID=3126740 RepID=UPI0030D3D692